MSKSNYLKPTLTLFVLTIMQLAQIQAQQPVNYSFGVRFEPNLNWLYIDNKKITSDGISADINFGIMVNKHFSEKVQIGSGVNIINASPRINVFNVRVEHANKKADTATVNNYQLQYSTRYLEIPLILVMNTREMHNKIYYGEAGISTAFLIRAKADVSSSFKQIKNINIQSPVEEDNYELTEPGGNKVYNQEVFPVRFAAVIGAGVKFGVLINSYVTIGARFNLGLNNVFKEEGWRSENSYGGLNIGFIF